MISTSESTPEEVLANKSNAVILAVSELLTEDVQFSSKDYTLVCFLFRSLTLKDKAVVVRMIEADGVRLGTAIARLNSIESEFFSTRAEYLATH